MRILARTAIAARAVAAGAHQNGRKRRPTTGCCMRPHKASLHDTPPARSRPPLPLAAGHAARQADLLYLEEVFCAHGHARDRPDRSAVHTGQQQRWQQIRTKRQGARHTMVQGRRRGLVHIKYLSMDWTACKKSEGARSTAPRMPTKLMTGSCAVIYTAWGIEVQRLLVGATSTHEHVGTP